jgi:hypothetical protein
MTAHATGSGSQSCLQRRGKSSIIQAN